MIELKPLHKPTVSEISIPGSKSYTNRSLLMAALTKGTVRINQPLFSDDTAAMVDCLTKLGIKMKLMKDYILVEGDVGQVKEKKYRLNAHFSGTTIRFILALSCIVPGIKIIGGEEGLNKRPITELVKGLRQLRADIDYLKKEGFPPLIVKSSKLSPGRTKLSGDISSQYFSAILMIAPVVGEVIIEVLGKQISKPYIDMTIDTMNKFGVKVINEHYRRYIVPKDQSYSAKAYTVEGDFSSAGYFFAIAALTSSKITVKNLNPKSKQADVQFLKILERMRNKVGYGDNQVSLLGRGIKPVRVNMVSCPDQVQTLAVLAAFAKGVTHIAGVKSLRIKETERVKALENELKKMGIKTRSTKDTLTIYGGRPKPAIIETYGDHRMAMSFAVAGTKLAGVKIRNPQVVSKTFPTFWQTLKSLGVEIRSV